MKKFYDKYRHAIPLIIYGIVYGVWFSYLERTVKHPQTIIHMKLDDFIPFNEVFVVPYFMWFAYIACIIVYGFFKNKKEYYRSCAFLFTGMTIFLIISTLWPNGHHLRPAIMPRDNVFSSMVAHLYSIDTPTNLWPSIHVYNSIGAHLTVLHTPSLRKNKFVHIGSLILCTSIILSTVFLKQHSTFDVLTAFIMATVMYVLVYQVDVVAALQAFKARYKGRRVHQA